MKKTAIYTIICAFALTFTSCQFIKDKIQELTGISLGSEDADDDDVEAVYEDETYEIDDVIDPYDEDAYERYVGKNVEKVSVEEKKAESVKEDKAESVKEEKAESVKENKSGSVKDGILNEKITTSSQIDKLMDLYDADCEKLQRILDSKGFKDPEVDKILAHLNRINKKLGECSDLMSWQQLQRMLKQTESLEMLLNSRR